MVNHQIQQIQSTVSSIEAVVNWKTEDPRLTDDMKQQFLMKTRTRRSQASDRISPKERVPLATTDFAVSVIFLQEGVQIHTHTNISFHLSLLSGCI